MKVVTGVCPVPSVNGMRANTSETPTPDGDLRSRRNRKDTPDMITKLLAPAFLIGAATAAIAAAPVAGATASQCSDTGMASMCQRTGHSAIVATPDIGNTTTGFGWGMGTGPMPPIWAMD